MSAVQAPERERPAAAERKPKQDQPKREETEAENELRCTLCGLRACWTKGVAN